MTRAGKVAAHVGPRFRDDRRQPWRRRDFAWARVAAGAFVPSCSIWLISHFNVAARSALLSNWRP
ncbi:hypothetical protein CFB81_30795 [Burkholderia sp. AU28863]|nr:hypothetical protein CFB81_30795 [Burkholderia sp. AU28863]